MASGHTVGLILQRQLVRKGASLQGAKRRGDSTVTSVVSGCFIMIPLDRSADEEEAKGAKVFDYMHVY